MYTNSNMQQGKNMHVATTSTLYIHWCSSMCWTRGTCTPHQQIWTTYMYVYLWFQPIPDLISSTGYREREGREGEETESIICIHSSVGPRPPLTISVIEPLHIKPSWSWQVWLRLLDNCQVTHAYTRCTLCTSMINSHAQTFPGRLFPPLLL